MLRRCITNLQSYGKRLSVNENVAAAVAAETTAHDTAGATASSMSEYKLLHLMVVGDQDHHEVVTRSAMDCSSNSVGKYDHNNNYRIVHDVAVSKNWRSGDVVFLLFLL